MCVVVLFKCRRQSKTVLTTSFAHTCGIVLLHESPAAIRSPRCGTSRGNYILLYVFYMSYLARTLLKNLHVQNVSTYTKRPVSFRAKIFGRNINSCLINKIRKWLINLFDESRFVSNVIKIVK